MDLSEPTCASHPTRHERADDDETPERFKRATSDNRHPFSTSEPFFVNNPRCKSEPYCPRHPRAASEPYLERHPATLSELQIPRRPTNKSEPSHQTDTVLSERAVLKDHHHDV